MRCSARRCGGDVAIGHAEQPQLEPRYAAVLRHALRDGTAYERFAAMVQAQGGNLLAFERPADPDIAIEAPESGVVTSVDGPAIGEAVVPLRALRRVIVVRASDCISGRVRR